MPYLFTLFCSCLNIPRIRAHSPYRATERQESTNNKQTKHFPENESENFKLSTIKPTHLNISTPHTPHASKPNQTTDFFEHTPIEENLHLRPFSRICPSAIFNRADIPC